MRILVLEDEPLVAESLIKMLRQLEPEADIEGPVATVLDAKRLLECSRPELIISDIQLADGVSLDLFTEVQISCPVIFTTAYNEYAIRAFKINSIDYLLKPVDKHELKNALEKFHNLTKATDGGLYLDQLSQMFEDFRSRKKFKERFTVHFGKNLVLVRTPDVAGFVKEELIYLIDSEGKKYITDFRSLDEAEELLDPAQFFRANRQAIIALDHIASMHSDEAGKMPVKMRQPQFPEVVVSKEKAAAFRKWLAE